jgi:cytochrome P450
MSPARHDALPPGAPFPAAIQTLLLWRAPHAYLEWCARRYGRSFTVKPVGMPPLVFLSDPVHIKEIVRAPAHVLHAGAGGRVIAPLVGTGSFMLADEDDHLTRRRTILPAFHQHAIESHADLVDEIVSRQVAAWPRDTVIALHPRLRALALSVILRTIFTEDVRVRELHRRLLDMFSVAASLALQEPQLRALPPWRGIWRRFLAERRAVSELVLALIRDGQVREQGPLSLLLAARDLEGDGASQVRDDLMSLILAGHETTASQLAWAFQLIAHHPKVAARLSRDLADGCERYLTATIQEVLRHRPVFLFTIPRVVRRPLQIEDRAYGPPVHLVGCIHLMHHDPDLYPEPQAFRPERFLDAPPAAERWLPWGGGRKRCPGHHLAILEMASVLRTVLRELDVLPATRTLETARWRSVIVTPGAGCRVLLRKCSQPTFPKSTVSFI